MKQSDVFFGMIKERFAPILRADGFKGSGRTFRRVNGECIHILNLQAISEGGKCAVNLAINFTFLSNVALADMREYHCDIRRRLIPDSDKSDFWWDFGVNNSTTELNVSHLINTYKSVGVPYFSKYGVFPGIYSGININDIKSPSRDVLPGGTTNTRYALLFAKMQLHLMQPLKAKEFLLYGLETCGPMASGIRYDIQNLLNDIDKSNPSRSINNENA